ncbi:hypothetical protein H5410_056912 [Solanum commersonii]|uniref:Uncharacterized protein n=1 Tax=Solanum commersonii TaxID=4109 RepID=A0A9J5WMM0_SOLCO|nr:hypothetical protein H5410_056912 [Solanum commersonii]
MTEREVKRGSVYAVAPSFEALVPTSDSTPATSSAQTSSLVVAGGTSESISISVISIVPKIIDISVNFSWSTSLLSLVIAAFRVVTYSMAPWPRSHTVILVAKASIVELKGVISLARALSIMLGMVASTRVSVNRAATTTKEPTLEGKVVVEELSIMEGVVLDVCEGPGIRVGKGASAGNASISTIEDVSTGASFFFSTSSFKYSSSILRMHLSLSAQIGDQYRKREGSLALLGPHDHLLCNDNPQVQPFPNNDATKTGCFCVAENRLILGWHDSTVNRAKRELCCYI